MNVPAAADRVQVGSVLRETYELTALLGRGGMGVVYVAKHLRLPGKSVAVKVIEGAVAGEEAHRRFRREAEIAARLNHPNIVEVLDYDTLPDGTPFLVLELLRGESLGARLAKYGKLRWEHARAIVRQTGSGLRAAHRAGVIHRDLKPDNIFIIPTESDGVVTERVKLLDFGISKSSQTSTLKTQDAVLMGTPQYMSPEQALGKNSTVDARSDVFALGCIVYEMLSGQSPFAGNSIPEVVYKVVHHEPASLTTLEPSLSAEIASSVAKAMAKSPDARFPDVASFIEMLTGSPLQTLSEPVVISQKTPSEVVGPAASSGEQDGLFEPTMRPTPPKAAVPSPALPAAVAVAAPVAQAPVSTRPERGQTTEKMSVGLWPWLAVSTLLVAVVGGGFWMQRRTVETTTPSRMTSSTQSHPEKSFAPLPDAVSAPVPLPVPIPVEPKRAASVRPSVASSPSSSGLVSPTSEVAPSSVAPARPALPRLPKDAGARDDLAAARAALKRSDGREALRLVQRSQRAELSGASFAVETQAYCLLGDLSNARAKWPSVEASEQGAVRQYCGEHDVDFSER